MYKASYNDYELIYLISEGSEQALDLLYHKYYIYICKRVKTFKIPNYKKEDLVQEGVNTLFDCIRSFNPQKYKKTFYNYFTFVLERKLYRVINNSTYYSNNVILTESVVKDEPINYNTYIITKYRDLLTKDLDKEIFDKCLVEGLSIGAFAKSKGVEYKKIYYRAKCICERLKKY